MLSGRSAYAQPGSATSAFELSELSKRFGHGSRIVTAVDEVSLIVPTGQVIGLLGANGAGKTTIIKMIAGLVTPTSGTAVVHGYDIRRQRGQAVGHIGAVLEGSRNIYWSLSVWQNLVYFGRLKGLRLAEIKPRAERLLTELELWNRRKDAVGVLSRGMQQKVAIAAALVADPPVLLLDEPTIGLDVEAARTVRHWVTKLARAEGKTILLTTHQLAMAEELCERIAIIRDGRLVADLPKQELIDRYAEDRYAIRLATPANSVRTPLPQACEVQSVDGQAVVLVHTADQDELHGLLTDLRLRGLSLVSVSRARPNLEEIFVRLVREG